MSVSRLSKVDAVLVNVSVLRRASDRFKTQRLCH